VGRCKDGAHAASRSRDETIKLSDAANGQPLASLFTYQGNGIALTPDNLFIGGVHLFAIVRGLELLPVDEFIAFNRRESLADALKETAAAR
jgi:hypothetical protein